MLMYQGKLHSPMNTAQPPGMCANEVGWEHMLRHTQFANEAGWTQVPRPIYSILMLAALQDADLTWYNIHAHKWASVRGKTGFGDAFKNLNRATWFHKRISTHK
jgi:hypothetical protein